MVPAPVPEGAPILDGVVCIQFGPPASSSGSASLTVAEPLVCHPAGEPFEVNASVVVTTSENATVQMAVPYTVTHRPAGAPEDLVVSTGQVELPSFSLVKAADALTIGLYGVDHRAALGVGAARPADPADQPPAPVAEPVVDGGRPGWRCCRSAASCVASRARG